MTLSLRMTSVSSRDLMKVVSIQKVKALMLGTEEERSSNFRKSQKATTALEVQNSLALKLVIQMRIKLSSLQNRRIVILSVFLSQNSTAALSNLIERGSPKLWHSLIKLGQGI